MSVVFGPPARSAWRLLDPVQMARNLWRHRDLAARLIGQEVTQRYRGSYLGMVWSFVTPVLMLSVYAFVFSIVFQARWGELGGVPHRGEYALTLFAGLLAFGVFSEVVNRAPTLVLTMPNYVKKVVFPLEILPVVALGSAVVHSLISVLILVVATGLMVWLHYLVNHTTFGLAVRATAEDKDAASLMGIEIDRVIAMVFVLGPALGAAAGVLFAMYYGVVLWNIGFLAGIKAFTAAVLGGIGNIPGAMLGGLLLGLVETFGAGYLPILTHDVIGPEYKDIFAFIILILVLVFRPMGILGERVSR